MILASSASFPIGVTKRAGNVLTFNRPFDFDAAGRWDFEGLEVYLEADATLTRPHFHVAGGNAHFLHVGEAGRAPNVAIVGGDLDGSDLHGEVGEAAVQFAGGTLATKGCNFHDAPRDHLSQFMGSWSSQGDRFGLSGTGVGPTSHVDGVAHIYGGSVDLDGCMVDMRLNGRPKPTCGWTGLIYLQATRLPILATIRNTVMLGAADLGLLYPIQTNARSFFVQLALQGNVIEPGIHGKVVGDTPAAGGPARISGIGNINALSGAPLTVFQ